MNELDLVLSERICGRLRKRVNWTETSFFILNKSFEITKIRANGIEREFSRAEIVDNYAFYKLADVMGELDLEISYSGILDGSTGVFPYVREKSTDKFYLLRIETVYYPLFVEPYSDEFMEYCLDESDDARYKVKVETEDGRMVCSNLSKVSENEFCGFMPTFAVGNYKEERFDFGSIYVDRGSDIDLSQTVSMIHDTNEFMRRYKDVSIRDFSIITIPEGYGSFVLPGTMFITEDGLCKYRNIVHETIHTNWNPVCKKKNVQNTRFFDEALTQYFMSRVCDFYGWEKQSNLKNEFINTFAGKIRGGYEVVPISQYAECDYGDLSYCFGPLFFFALEECLGREALDECLHRMLEEYDKKEIDFETFRALLPNEASDVFDEYVTTNTAAKELLGL